MKAISVAGTADGAAEAEVALMRVIKQIAEVREQMKADDAEIARIRAESAALKKESAALKTEGTALRAETRAIIAGLWGTA